MNEELIVSTLKNENTVVVSISGEADIYTSEKLESELTKAIKGNEGSFRIDCRDLSYIDSTGLGVFASILKRTKEQGSEIVLVGLKNNIRKLFNITGLDKLFVIEE